MKKSTMQKYARLIAQKGANVQKNQEVFIDAGLDQPEFVKMLVEECYRKGAKKVTVEWDYQPLTKVNYRYRSLKTLSTMDKWQIEKYQHKVDVLPAMIYLESDDPDGLKGVDQQKVAKAQQALYPIIKPMREKMESKYQWCRFKKLPTILQSLVTTEITRLCIFDFHLLKRVLFQFCV